MWLSKQWNPDKARIGHCGRPSTGSSPRALEAKDYNQHHLWTVQHKKRLSKWIYLFYKFIVSFIFLFPCFMIPGWGRNEIEVWVSRQTICKRNKFNSIHEKHGVSIRLMNCALDFSSRKNPSGLVDSISGEKIFKKTTHAHWCVSDHAHRGEARRWNRDNTAHSICKDIQNQKVLLMSFFITRKYYFTSRHGSDLPTNKQAWVMCATKSEQQARSMFGRLVLCYMSHACDWIIATMGLWKHYSWALQRWICTRNMSDIIIKLIDRLGRQAISIIWKYKYMVYL